MRLALDQYTQLFPEQTKHLIHLVTGNEVLSLADLSRFAQESGNGVNVDQVGILNRHIDDEVVKCHEQRSAFFIQPSVSFVVEWQLLKMVASFHHLQDVSLVKTACVVLDCPHALNYGFACCRPVCMDNTQAESVEQASLGVNVDRIEDLGLHEPVSNCFESVVSLS